MHPQLPLPLDPQRLYSFASFWVGENALLVDVLQKMAAGAIGDLQLFITGNAGSGKTHLLTATCQAASDDGYRIAYLDAELIGSSDSLDGYSQYDLVCIDNLQHLPDGPDGERALFGLVNALRQNQGRLVMSADRGVGELAVTLPDLRTRLAWGAVYQLVPVPDNQLGQALAMRAEFSGLALNPEVLNYLTSRQSRELASLVMQLQTLGDASIRQQRKITIPFVREVLGSDA